MGRRGRVPPKPWRRRKPSLPKLNEIPPKESLCLVPATSSAAPFALFYPDVEIHQNICLRTSACYLSRTLRRVRIDTV